MTSLIDTTKPVYGNPTTQSVRDNFLHAYDEITALQAKTAQAPFLPIAGGIMNGAITMQTDPLNPMEVATKRYIDNLAFGASGTVPEAPTDGMYYARGQTAGGNTWSKTPLFDSVHFGPNGATDRFNIGSDATYNFIKFSSGNDFLRFNRTTNAFESTMPFVLPGNPTAALQATPKQYVDTFMPKTGGVFAGNVSFDSAIPAPSDRYESWLSAGEIAIRKDRHIGFNAYISSTSGPVWRALETGYSGSISVSSVGALDFAVNASVAAGQVATGLRVLSLDQRGNVGFSIAPPTGAHIFDSGVGGWTFSQGITADNHAFNVYYGAAGDWRSLRGGYGWMQSFNPNDGHFYWYSFPNVAANAAGTFTATMDLFPGGRLAIHADATNDGMVYIDTIRPNGYARVFVGNSQRLWSSGLNGSTAGWGIFDESASVVRFGIDTSGTATFTNNLVGNGNIQSMGGRLISYGANNCSVTCYRPGFAAGFFVGGGDTNLYFASMTGAGDFLSIYAYFDAIGSFITSNNVYIGNGGSLNDPLKVTVANGYNARTRYTVANVTDWSCGCLSNGYFAINNESAGAAAFRIRTSDWAIQAMGVGLSFIGGAWQTGSTFTMGWNNMVAGLVTLSIDNGGAAYAIAAGSDVRMKSGVTTSDLDCLSVVESLKLRQFRWRDLR